MDSYLFSVNSTGRGVSEKKEDEEERERKEERREREEIGCGLLCKETKITT